MNKWIESFAFLVAGATLSSASWRAGLGLLLTGWPITFSSDFLIAFAIGILSIYLTVCGLWFFYRRISEYLKHLFRHLGR